MDAVAILFWLSVVLLVYTHAGYPLTLWALTRFKRTPPARTGGELPSVSLVVAAYDEEDVIAAKVRNALELEYPRERLQVIVASDGSTDRTFSAAIAAVGDDDRFTVISTADVDDGFSVMREGKLRQFLSVVLRICRETACCEFRTIRNINVPGAAFIECPCDRGSRR